ncbi:MAG: hypothetical protein AAFR63_03520 [Cyanobacteria bacterium J06631_6]
MEISPFELLLKRIAPRNQDGGVAEKLKRTVVQGYFLTLSNLESQKREFKFEVTISAPTEPADKPNVSRRLEERAVLLFDIAGDNQKLSLKTSEENDSFIKYASGTLTLPSLATVSVQLLPDIQKFIDNQFSLLEARGFISIEAADEISGSVFLNPEIRGTFFPDDFAINENPDFDQLSYSLGLSRVTV